jgi:hypothetical protein
MERERLTRLLEDPSRMVREDLAGLEALARQYPWFSGARLLHAAGERLSGRVMADETLRSAAAHLPSRAALFDLANQVAAPQQAPLRVVRSVPPAEAPRNEPTASAASAVLSGPALAEAPAPPAAHQPDDAARLEIEAPAPDPAPVAAPLVPLAPVKEQLAEDRTNAGTPGTPPAASTGAPDELAEEYVKAAMAQAYDLTWQDRLPERPEASMPERPKPPIAQDARLRFSDWLTAAEAPTAMGATTIATSPSAPTVAPPDPKALDAKALIDRFIRQQPPEIPAKPSFFTPQQAARKSLDDTSGFVTETLARIYAEQGNIEKAKEAYHRLALKYPEKSAYFADLSKALEDQQHP